jgi:hypothetical protein
VNVIPAREVELTRSKPKSETRFGAVACTANEDVWRDVDGRVRVCTVARRVTLFGIDVAAGAYTHFHEDGSPYQTQLARPMALRSSKDHEVRCAAGLLVRSTAGALEHCTLARSLALGERVCRKGESVAFHPTGELAGCVIDGPHTALGTTFLAGTRLSWYPGGALAGGWSAEPLTLRGVRVRWQFSFHESGALRSASLDEKRTFQGNELPARAKVLLREDGSIWRAEYEHDSGFMPHGEPWEDTAHVRYDCHGRVVTRRIEHFQAERPPRPRWKTR